MESELAIEKMAVTGAVGDVCCFSSRRQPKFLIQNYHDYISLWALECLACGRRFRHLGLAIPRRKKLCKFFPQVCLVNEIREASSLRAKRASLEGGDRKAKRGEP
jgi:hypothetical protein